MKKRYLKSLLILLMIAFVVSCTSSDDDSNTTSAVTKEAVIAKCNLVSKNTHVKLFLTFLSLNLSQINSKNVRNI